MRWRLLVTKLLSLVPVLFAVSLLTYLLLSLLPGDPALQILGTEGASVTALHHLVSQRVSPKQRAVLGIGTVHGGIRENVVADEVTMTGTVRTMDAAVRQGLEDDMRLVVRGTAESWGAGHRLQYEHGYPVLVNDPQMTDVAKRAAELVLDPSTVIAGGWPPGMPADDFARYLEVVPGAYAGFGVGTPGSVARPIIHNSDYLLDESGLSAGVAWYLSLVLNFQQLRNGDEAGQR